MGTYYEEILEEINTLKNEKKYDEAMSLIKRELDMPYIPSDAEDKLKEYKKDLTYLLAEKRPETEESLDSLLHRLKGKPQSQLSAASQLSSRNLREFLPELKDYLSKDPQPEASAMLLEAIAEQEIQEDFVMQRDGVTYEFYGDSMTPVAESKGFLKADHLLKEWLELKNPGLYKIARTLLINEVYMFLPLSYEASEGYTLAKDIVYQVSDMMGDEEIKDLVLTK